jgi:hypothetical protein
VFIGNPPRVISTNAPQRLTTTHTALSSHISHQIRQLTSLVSSFFSPLSPPLALDAIEVLLPLIEETIQCIPQPAHEPLYALTSLSHSTSDLLSTLSQVSDTLHMSRQNTSGATRRLRTAKEALTDWRRDQALRDEGQYYLEKGDWDRRLREREAASVCRDVVGGFEEMCGRWRQKLVDGVEAG